MKIRGVLVPTALALAITSPFAVNKLEQLEGNILGVYADHLANGIPTRCAGDTNHDMPVGTKLSSDQCKAINAGTMLEYGGAVLACTDWSQLTPNRLIGLTLFAVNVGKSGACNSQAFKAINQGAIVAGCNLLARKPDGSPNWSNAGGQYVQGLQNRRQAERALCLM